MTPPVFGVTCFQTNAPASVLSTEAITSRYRRKNRVEEAFHEIKSPFALRPLFVRRSERIRAHVMTCVLAYGLYNAMEERLRQHHRPESPETVLRELASGQMNRLRIQSTGQTRITLSQPAPESVATSPLLSMSRLSLRLRCSPSSKRRNSGCSH